MITNLVTARGVALLGLASVRAGVAPRWARGPLITSGVAKVVFAAPFPFVMSTMIGRIRTLMGFLGIVWIGDALRAVKGEALH